jgi:hypothetical protein
MEVHDGFIVGVDNYCDRWCERCAFTSWCRLFADSAKLEAAHDPELKAVVDAPLLPHEVPPPAPLWLKELLEQQELAAADEEPAPLRPERRPEHDPILERAFAYSLNVHRWRNGLASPDSPAVDDPRAVILWFGTLLPAKVGRALSRSDSDDEKDYEQSDQEGSAKVALIGIEESHAAWLDLVARGHATDATVQPFIADLIWMADELERVFPGARTFVRPGLDEPDAVARLLESRDTV